MIKTENYVNGSAAAGTVMPIRVTDIHDTKSSEKCSENDYYKVICPFFCDLSGHTIRCEGIIPHTKSVTSFGNVRRMKKHRRVYCNTFSYESCELCRALMKKYE